jgi:hypothetical protein
MADGPTQEARRSNQKEFSVHIRSPLIKSSKPAT